MIECLLVYHEIIKTVLYFGTFVDTVYYNQYDIDAMSLMNYYVGIFRRAVWLKSQFTSLT